MTNRYLLGTGVALAVALGGAQAHAQLFPWNQPGVAGAWYIGPEGGWTSLNSNNSGTVSGVSFTGGPNGNTTFTTPGTANPARNFASGFNVGVRGGYQWGPWRFRGRVQLPE